MLRHTNAVISFSAITFLLSIMAYNLQKMEQFKSHYFYLADDVTSSDNRTSLRMAPI